MKTLGIIAIVLGWLFISLVIFETLSVVENRDFVLNSIAFTAELLITIIFIFILHAAIKHLKP